MSQELNENRLAALADQLSCPSGADGIKTADQMALSNSNMIGQTIIALNIGDKDNVLEIGPGNGIHVAALLEQSSNALYYGAEISELMIAEASRLNEKYMAVGRAFFSLTDGENLDFADEFFTKIFTVNTLYFWADPLAYAQEILRVLKGGGTFLLTFASRSFMEKLPFTQYGFRLYSEVDAKELLQQAGFEIDEVSVHNETITSNAGMQVDREFFVIKAIKPLSGDSVL